MNPPARLLRNLLHRSTARYLTVSAKGLHLGRAVNPTAVVRILGFSPARTLYRARRPVCRSLDGAISVTHADRRCESCAFQKECTGQVRVDLLIAGRPYRVLLAYTSAKNFLIYETELRAENIPIEDIEHRLDVIDRGHFGELRFTRAV